MEDNNSSTSTPTQQPDICILALGSHVRVKRLKKNGIICEILSNDRYRVSVDTLTITCSATELTVRNAVEVVSSQPIKMRLPKVVAPATTLDLHGNTVQEAIRKLEFWLDRAILADLSRLKVIHGFGSGKVQNAVHEYLRSQKAVASFKINQFNSGETDIFL